MTEQEISDFELFLNLKNLEILKDFSGKEIEESNANFIINLLDKLLIYFPYNKHSCSFKYLYRLVINKRIVNNNVRLTQVVNLKYPPKKELVKKYGRCNLPQQNILYASLSRMTALDEMRPQKGDLITETVWKKKSDKRLTYIPIFANQPTNQPMINPNTGEIIPGLINTRTFEINQQFHLAISNYPKNLRLLSIKLVQFFADCFSKQVNWTNHFNYLFSAYIADKLLNKVDKEEIDAIYYPSVADKLNSENMAIKPTSFDDIYEPFGVIESVITQDPSQGLGGYHMNMTLATTTFDFKSDEIVWNEEKSTEATFKILDCHY